MTLNITSVESCVIVGDTVSGLPGKPWPRIMRFAAWVCGERLPPRFITARILAVSDAANEGSIRSSLRIPMPAGAKPPCS